MNISVDIKDMKDNFKISHQKLLLTMGYSTINQDPEIDEEILDLANNLIKKIKRKNE